ncbi:gephyrin-like molybdotransferase Glp [Paenibacillus sp. GCM10023252]|uniref:molybdopterin molybdotransferase MoeA n=1 Tax=Paenibacillus sp. GCM10023252 TaxID=3252649 RepID=UPI00362205DC
MAVIPGERQIVNHGQRGDIAHRFNRRAVKVSTAQELVLAAARAVPCGVETVPLRQCSGRRLAHKLEATCDWPPFARSGLDGYAVRAADCAEASPGQPATLRVVDSVAAGGVATAAVEPGTAVRIMTGAAVPDGADAVVMLEQTAEALLAGGEAAAVQVKHAARPGQNIAPRGEEFRLGSALAEPGTRLRPGHVALLGTFGYADVPVYRRPRVAVFATGSELLPVASPLAPGQIRDSNSPMVAAMAEHSGAEVISFGTLPDEPGEVAAALARALEDADLIVTTGGVSVGDHDVMADIVRALRQGSLSAANPVMDDPRSRVLFDRVAMRPGSPTSAAVLSGKLLVALSGNPGACFVGFELFVRPAIHAMMGVEEALPRRATAHLASGITKGSPHERYVRARLAQDEEGRLLADPLAYNKSSMMASLADADCLAIIPSGSQGAEQGEKIDVILI